MAQKHRLRRTMMFIPGNNPGMMRDAHIYGSDSLMFDLEDSVSMAEKDAARQLVYQALKTIDYGSTEIVVRINPLDTPYGRADVEAMVAAGAQVLRMPKTETPQDIIECEKVIAEMEDLELYALLALIPEGSPNYKPEYKEKAARAAEGSGQV